MSRIAPTARERKNSEYGSRIRIAFRSIAASHHRRSDRLGDRRLIRQRSTAPGTRDLGVGAPEVCDTTDLEFPDESISLASERNLHSSDVANHTPQPAIDQVRRSSKHFRHDLKPTEKGPIPESKKASSPDSDERNSEWTSSVSLTQQTEARVPWKHWTMMGWAIGTGISILIALVRWLGLRRLMWKKTVRTPDRLNELALTLAKRLGISSHVRIRVLDSPIGPAVTGCFRPVILLPRFEVGLDSIDTTKALIAHELIHYRRGDVWLTLLPILAKSMLWFHPVAWLASSRLDREAERCCGRGDGGLSELLAGLLRKNVD